MSRKAIFTIFITKDVPNPELLIRTKGEQRISNFTMADKRILNCTSQKITRIWKRRLLRFHLRIPKKRKEIWKNIRTIKKQKLKKNYNYIFDFVCKQ